ncbi:MAG: PilZ domain-containing protein, partial [Mariprofundaceae bacterium]
RWAHGMVQVFMLQNPLIIKGLSFWQRMCYLNMTSFWFFSFMRLVFLLAPAAYLIFDIRLYDAPVSDILIYAMPHVVAYVLFFNVMFGRLRWFLVSDVYEVLQTLFSIRTVFRVLLHPKRGTFAVTPKDESIQEDFISPVAATFYILLAILAVSFVAGLIKVIGMESDPVGIDIVVTFWAFLSFVLVLGSVGVLHEKKQVRKTTRFDVNLKANLISSEQEFEARTVDLSAHGVCLHVNNAKKNDFKVGDKVKVQVYCSALKKDIESHVKVCMSRPLNTDSGILVIGLDFQPTTVQEEQDIVALTYGESERWRDVLKKRNVAAGFSEGSAYFFKVCLPLGVMHIYRQLLSVIKGKKSYLEADVKKESL